MKKLKKYSNIHDLKSSSGSEPTKTIENHSDDAELKELVKILKECTIERKKSLKV